MNEITHGQAKQYMLADLDGLLTSAGRLDLETHLRACETCRADSESLAALTARLPTEFHARWDAQDGPSEQVLQNIHMQSRRIKMSKQIDFAFNLLGGLAAVLVVGFIAISLISQFQERAVTTANGTETNIPASAPQSEDRLIAFVSMDERGNRDIYTMRSDGSGLTNLTNNLATDDSPAWSPDGTQIAFVSDRSGGKDIYIMNADGSNVRKLTDSSTFNDRFSWSPDGQKIIYLSGDTSLNISGQLMLMNADGSSKIALTDEKSAYSFLGWSPDGKKVVYRKQVQDSNAVTPFTALSDATIYIVDIDGANRHESIVNNITRVQWEDSEHFIGIEFNWFVGEEQSKWSWSLYKFNTDGSAPVELASHTIPIVAIFDRTYVVEGQDSLGWFAYLGASIATSPWSFSRICQTPKTPTNPLLEETIHTISPDQQQDFVSLQCPEGTTYFYLMNSDGTKIQQLGEALAKPSQATGMEWSPDGKHVLVTVASNKGAELYRFDIQEMLKDPSIQPIQLITDSAMIYGGIWQPIP